MARTTSSRTKRRNTVPVHTRARDAQRTKPKKSPAQPKGLDILGVGVIIAVVLIVLLSIAVPLRNYYHGQSEIARLESSIAAKQEQKENLLTEIDKYRSEEYVKQEARRRFGVMDEGETAFRIMDPRMDSGDTVTSERREDVDERAWYTVLWDSVSQDAETPPNTETPPEAENPPEDLVEAPAE
ncbi:MULTISPECIES: septum formation initiator family protein [unclassified Corynebacterium]|uniref:septum formation initiator family protein n=1 Tax=unclassified Corynebacterium TaxID=2624378 RepID=UPI0008A4CFD1|nr:MULTISPECIES: septum formation initiator family protein [unclassified Corynebacterium]OFP31916.1 hypothetical protein HMPREF2993_06725 [Corynebacterium sp. HMSC068G04]OFQ53858.1 hypothetical protein HMPREF2932_00405 [Corynebacterium sp. HMSC074H12]